MGTHRIKVRHLDNNFKLPLNMMEMPTASDVGAPTIEEMNEVKKSVSDGKTSVANAITAKGVTTATDATFATMASNIGSIVTLKEGTNDATVVANKMLNGVVGYGKDGARVVGNIASQGAQTITPSTSNKTIASGKYLSGVQTIKGDSNLVAGNIKKGVSIFGVAGSYDPLSTASYSVAKNTISGGTYYDTYGAYYKYGTVATLNESNRYSLSISPNSGVVLNLPVPSANLLTMYIDIEIPNVVGGGSNNILEYSLTGTNGSFTQYKTTAEYNLRYYLYCGFSSTYSKSSYGSLINGTPSGDFKLVLYTTSQYANPAYIRSITYSYINIA